MSSYPSNSSVQQTGEHKNHPKIGLIITIVVILLIVVSGSIGGYLYVKGQPSTTSTQTISTTAPTKIPQGKPLFSDPLLNNNMGWDLIGKPGEFSVKIGNASMVLEDDNHIAISAKGPTMTFIVNGQTMKIITDNTYTSGSIAFFVSNLPHSTPGAQATFSNITIYPPQS